MYFIARAVYFIHGSPPIFSTLGQIVRELGDIHREMRERDDPRRLGAVHCGEVLLQPRQLLGLAVGPLTHTHGDWSAECWSTLVPAAVAPPHNPGFLTVVLPGSPGYALYPSAPGNRDDGGLRPRDERGCLVSSIARGVCFISFMCVVCRRSSSSSRSSCPRNLRLAARCASGTKE